MIDQETLKTFDKLYNESYQSVLKYVICNCSNVEDVKDIIQNVYLELLKILEKDKIFDKDTSYIIGIAKNKVNQHYRFNYKAKIVSLFSKKDDISLIDVIEDDIDLSEEAIKKDDIEFIFNYLKKKKIIVSQIFYLYYYCDMSIKSISEELNITISSVKHYLYKTLKELKLIMKERGDKNV